MSSGRKHKTSFKKKRKSTTLDYWGDDTSEPQYTEEQKKRIASYLKENDENCKESTTLILIIVIGLLVALSIVGFLAIRNNSAVKYKGAHTIYEHSSNQSILDVVWGKWTWLQNEFFGIAANNTNASKDVQELVAIVALEEELDDFQPIYRHPLLQQLYKDSNDDDCLVVGDDSVFQFLTIKHGAWIPSKQYLQEAVDFSWADFQTIEETEEQELEQTVDADQLSQADQKRREKLTEKIKNDRQKRKQEHQKQQQQPQTATARRLLDGEQAPPPQPPKGAQPRHGFDPLHALPNPANVIHPHSRGDAGDGDAEERAWRKWKEQQKQSGSKLPSPPFFPEWLKNKDFSKLPGFNGLSRQIRDHMPMGMKDRLTHLDALKKLHGGQGVRRDPRDILQNMDLSKYGIHNPVNDETTDQEKREDLAKLEQQESGRHPYMTLLTNPGQMNDVKCIKNDYRKHAVEFKQMSGDEAQSQINRGLDSDGKSSLFSYDNDVLMWYCYLIQLQPESIDNMNGGAFKVNLTFYDVDLEVGFDFVQIYINSQLIDTVSGIGFNWDHNEARPRFIRYIDSDYVEENGNSLEVCMKIVTDSSVTKRGFKSKLMVSYDDPQIRKWSDWSPCATLTPRSSRGNKNDRHWAGTCGVGIKSKSVLQCNDNTDDDAAANSKNNNIVAEQGCNVNENITEYCVKANCFDFPMAVDPDHPQQAFLFNGHGRVDPDFADPYRIQRSQREAFNISEMIAELAAVRDEIVERYPDERVLSTAVINHYYMDQSKLRLGIRLARSLLLGDAFTVYMTGSSNTAGHENMFMSAWPMQFQSMMRPIWKRIGYKGAAFVVKDHAEGGKISTMDLSWCIPSLIGDDADVVFWESQMNDHGAAVEHATENHFRNAITLPRRPLYHVMHAGKNGPDKGEYAEEYAESDKENGFKNEGACYGWICGNNNKNDPDYPGGILMAPYTDYGSGVTLFYPAYGLAAVNNTKYEEFSNGYLYVSWHPGPTGHRVYAEMLAYHYLSCVIQTLMDIKPLIDDLTPSTNALTKPIEEMLEILEDPPTKPLPEAFSAGHCDPFCTNATESVCISGYETLGTPRYSLRRFREKQDSVQDTGKWTYTEWFSNPQAFSYKQGGQASSDNKWWWYTNSADSTQLKFEFEAKQYGYIAIASPDIVKKVNDDKSVEIVINEIDMKSGLVDNENVKTFEKAGQPLVCNEGLDVPSRKKRNAKDWPAGDDGIGCNINKLKPYQKYEVVFNVLKDIEFGVKNIRIF